MAVRFGRLTTMLAGGGVALMAVAILLSCLPANAATGPDGITSPYGYTSHPSRVSTGRVVALYVDRDFDQEERHRIVSAIRQWNYVLNGYVVFRASLLPENTNSDVVSQIKRSGGWIVARVDSSHPVAHQGEGLHALAVTVGNSHSGFVYVISDRIGRRDLTGVVMHEFGHVLGAVHDSSGLMAPVYSAEGSRCIDRQAVAMVANAQHLPMAELNWCIGPGYQEPRPPMTSLR